jgi:hypothetical protein
VVNHWFLYTVYLWRMVAVYSLVVSTAWLWSLENGWLITVKLYNTVPIQPGGWYSYHILSIGDPKLWLSQDYGSIYTSYTVVKPGLVHC